MKVTLDFTMKEITVHGRADLKELNELAAKLGEGWAVVGTDLLDTSGWVSCGPKP